jgi:hypothetical protein
MKRQKYLGSVAPIITSTTREYARMQQITGPAPAIVMQGGSQIAAVPNRSQLDAYNVNRDGWEAITNTLYDSLPYPAAGLLVASFFTTPIGQGVGFGGGVKSFSDTNMTNPGSLPANQEFLITSIELLFSPTTPTVAAAMPAFFGAQAAAVLINDAYIFYRAGNLTLTIGSKAYCQEAPLMKFPAKAYFHLDAALSDATTAGAAFQNKISFGTARGRPYLLKAPLRLVSNQNFSVVLNWPEGLQVISNPARVTVSLDGILYRRSQ